LWEPDKGGWRTVLTAVDVEMMKRSARTLAWQTRKPVRVLGPDGVIAEDADDLAQEASTPVLGGWTVSGINQFFQALWREIVGAWELFTDFMISVFEPQSGLWPKVIFGVVLLFVVFWISKRGTKSA
jgi:hypothetical protein